MIDTCHKFEFIKQKKERKKEIERLRVTSYKYAFKGPMDGCHLLNNCGKAADRFSHLGATTCCFTRERTVRAMTSCWAARGPPIMHSSRSRTTRETRELTAARWTGFCVCWWASRNPSGASTELRPTMTEWSKDCHDATRARFLPRSPWWWLPNSSSANRSPAGARPTSLTASVNTPTTSAGFLTPSTYRYQCVGAYSCCQFW